MDFTIAARIEDFRVRIARFVEDEIMPLEDDRANYDAHENIRLDVLERLRKKAQAEGLWCLQLKEETGGQDLGKVGMAVCYEEMNRSIFGPCVFNAEAPDDGNMMVLEKVATDAQKERWLQPIVQGRVRSAFAMTEPHPGSGSDPGGMMITTARRNNDSYIIRGRKWFVTGTEESDHFILIARTSDDPRKGLSAFLHHKDTPGFRIDRRIPIMGPEEHGGHCEITYEDMEIPAENLLMEEGDGLKLTQIRLGPARLTHCMRWLGLSKRCVEIASTYAGERLAFGERLSNRESIQMMLGDLAMQIEIGRLLVMKAAWELAQGSFARKEVSMAKVYVANLLHQAADTA
ncbi:MAG: acyl-CoA dehydrogenase family protein, partial [Boseongicola sp.]|nr:acyl-CoA dehydrogenase family protein [Boseongicola sp.]